MNGPEFRPVPGVGDHTAPASLADTCAVCEHREEAHQDGRECVGCALMVRRPPWRLSHPFEPLADPRRTYLAKTGQVYSPTAGTHFDLGGQHFTVRPPCLDGGTGEWVCVSHAVRMATNPLKDFHCYHPDAPGGGPKASHLLVWNCWALGADGRHHGPERAGPAEWMGEEAPRTPF